MTGSRTASPAIAELTVDELDELEPLWWALQHHHSEVMPRLGHAPPRDRAEAWRRRRDKYRKWLEDPASFALVAREGERAIGYAFVTVGPGHAAWASGDRIAELETLSVLPAERNRGVGSALVDAVERRLRDAGVGDLAVTAAATNFDSHRFYERRGLARAFVAFYGSIDPDARDLGD